VASAVPGVLNADGSLALGSPAPQGPHLQADGLYRYASWAGGDMVAEYVDMTVSRRQESWAQPMR
jgi:hypothetical protein